MKKWIGIIFTIYVILAIGYYFTGVKTNSRSDAMKEQTETQIDLNKKSTALGEPTFEWTYSSFEEKEIPRTHIGLVARYPDGTTQTKDIDTIQGSCNEYANPDKDVYSKSKMIICYYAGFGDYYKVVASGDGYNVERKEFEEGEPDSPAVEQPFKTIAVF